MRRINICSRLQGGEILSEIKIDVDSLESGINNLKELKSKISTNKSNAPTVVGGGSTVANIEKIGIDFKNIEDKMELLLQNTISLLNNIKSSYVSSDKNAAKTIK